MAKTKVPRALVFALLRFALALLLVWGIERIVIALPMVTGVDIPDFPLAASQVVIAVVRLALLVVLLVFASHFARELRAAAPRLPASRSLVMYLAWAVAAFLAYQALNPTATYLLDERLWMFQILFLFLVLFPMVMFALTVYHSVGLVAAPRPSSAPAESAPVVGVTSSATQACRACGAPNLAGAKFCEVCGAPLAAQPSPTGPTVQQAAPVSAAAPTPFDAQPASLAPALDLAAPQTCPHCGAQNLPQAVFCEGCGQSLAAAPAGGRACPTCGAPNLPEAKFCEACGAALAEEVVAELCRTCGHANPKGSTFCRHCGAALVVAEDETQDVPATVVLCEACGAECVPTARFCAICGHTLGSPATKGTPAAPGADPDITADPGALQNPAADPDITVDPAALGNPAPGSTEPPTMPIQ